TYALIESVLRDATNENTTVPQFRGAEAAIAILEHEQMHQETLLYMFHEMPYEKKVPRAPLNPAVRGPRSAVREPSSIRIPAGISTLGNDNSLGWDNAFPFLRVVVPVFELYHDTVRECEYHDSMRAVNTSQ